MNLMNSQISEEGDGSFKPSKFTLFMGTKSKTDYKNPKYADPYKGDKKILVFCTDEGKMKMENGKVFNTGNHPIEMFGPMLYMRDAGFKFDFATSSGNPVVLEMWAYPTKDKNVKEMHEEVKSLMESPKKISDITSLDDYAAVFIPGGHGAMLNLPTNAALGKLLHIAHERSLPTVTLCHGPAALLSTCAEGLDKEFAYKGYEAMCFTDKTDAFTPKIGYLPGPMPWKCEAAVKDKGLKIMNSTEKGGTHVDRELITGDSPYAGTILGRLAAPIILKYAKDNNL